MGPKEAKPQSTGQQRQKKMHEREREEKHPDKMARVGQTPRRIKPERLLPLRGKKKKERKCITSVGRNKGPVVGEHQESARGSGDIGPTGFSPPDPDNAKEGLERKLGRTNEGGVLGKDSDREQGRPKAARPPEASRTETDLQTSKSFVLNEEKNGLGKGPEKGKKVSARQASNVPGPKRGDKTRRPGTSAEKPVG